MSRALPKSLFNASKHRFVRLSTYLGLFSLLSASLVLLLAWLWGGEIYSYQEDLQDSSLKLPQVDAIVVLAGGRGRILAGADLWFRYYEEASIHPKILTKTSELPYSRPTLYLSGMGPQVSWIGISKLIRQPVRSVLRSKDVIIEKESFNTEANARWFLREAQKKSWKSILLVTSAYHMRRARYIFTQVAHESHLPLEIQSYSVAQEPFSSSAWRRDWNGIRVTLSEALKLFYYLKFWQPGPVL